MPDLTFPSPWPLSDGDALTAAEFQSFFYSGSSPVTSLAILNGLMDEDNVNIEDIGAEHTQRGSAIDSEQVSGTANLDYFDYFWGDHSTATWDPDDVAESVAIPGASQKFFMPWAGKALIKFHLFWTNTSAADADRSVMFLRVNGSYITNQHRYVPRCIDTAAAPPVHEGYMCSRVWSGHYLAEGLSSGWNSAGIRLIGDENIKQTRVWARNMTVTRIKYP